MTREELKLIIEDRINLFVYECGAVRNPHLSQCDFNEVARPVARLAVLSGLAGHTCGSYSAYPSITRAYLDSLSFIVRNEKASYISDMKKFISDLYDNIHRVISDDDNLDNWDLMSVIEDMFEEAKR